LPLALDSLTVKGLLPWFLISVTAASRVVAVMTPLVRWPLLLIAVYEKSDILTLGGYSHYFF
jgi:hypothetical protein